MYYVNWLDEHRGDFELAAQKRLGTTEANWSYSRLIIIAQSYAKWDTYAVKQMGEGIELWRYVVYGEDLLHLELVFGQPRSATGTRGLTTQKSVPENIKVPRTTESAEEDVYSLAYHLRKGSEKPQQLFNELSSTFAILRGKRWVEERGQAA